MPQVLVDGTAVGVQSKRRVEVATGQAHFIIATLASSLELPAADYRAEVQRTKLEQIMQSLTACLSIQGVG